jgi:hypothetical protein
MTLSHLIQRIEPQKNNFFANLGTNTVATVQLRGLVSHENHLDAISADDGI